MQYIYGGGVHVIETLQEDLKCDEKSKGHRMVVVSHSAVEVACFPLWFDMLKAVTIIPRRGMLSILCFFFSLELCGKIASSFFQKGAGHLSSTKCKQQPNPLIRGLGEWMHDAFRELGKSTVYQVTLTINDTDRPCDSVLNFSQA